MILVFFILSLIIGSPIIKDNTIIHGNDLMVGTSNYVYLKESIIKYHTFPQWNPFMGQGLPIVNDPLNNFLNPFIFLLFMILPFIIAVKTFIILCIFFSGIFFYILSRYFKIGSLFSLLASATYMSSGFLAARIIAGHFEWILAYSIIPLLYYALIRLFDKKNIFWSGTISMIITIFIFSGNLYVAYYSLLVMLFCSIYFLIQSSRKRNNKKESFKIIKYLISSVILIPFFSAAKVLPMLEISQDLIRNYNPFLGSQNIFSIIYNFFIPSNVLFKNLGLENYVASPYLWWESFAYIGPFILIGMVIFLAYIKKIKNQYIYLLLYLSLLLTLYSFLDNILNPFYWFIKEIPALETFRVPSRIFIMLTPLVLLISTLGFYYFFERTKKIYFKLLILVFLVLNLASTIFIFHNFYYTKIFPPINKNFYSLLDYLKLHDNSYYYVAQSIFFQNQLPLYYAIGNHQKIFDPMGGWGLKGNPAGSYATTDFTGTTAYKDVYPKYFIYPDNYSPPKTFDAKIIKTIGNANLYKSPLYTPYAYLTKNVNSIVLRKNDDINIKKISIGVNTINVTVYSPSNLYNLVLFETNFKNWNVRIDGQRATIQDYRFLAVNTKQGTHTYTFIFFSIYFVVGFFISLAVLILWFFIGLRTQLLEIFKH